MKSDDQLIRRGWRGWLALFGVWTVPLALIGGANYVGQQYYDQPVGLAQTLILQALRWYFWAALCPVVYRLARELSLVSRHWPRNALTHFVIAMGVSAISVIIYGLTMPALETGTMPDLLRVLRDTFGVSSFTIHLFNLLIYWLTLGALTSISLNRQRLSRGRESDRLALRATQLQARLNESRLEALRMQLHPHFLFNALNSISSLIEDKQNDAAYRTIARLAALMRSTLNSTREHMTTLREELGFVNSYLEIERIRFEERLKTGITAPEECQNALTPSLILQPLVENSIRHSVAKSSHPGRIEIRARKEYSRLTIEVQDNGPGLPQRWSLENGAGVGLTIVRERLQGMYNGAHEFSVTNAQPCGTLARICIPFTTTEGINTRAEH
ncbi:MAG: sensor histidine kinase [Candidatus Zixiibacteriota bacterium]